MAIAASVAAPPTPPAASSDLDTEKYLGFYEKMFRIREFEDMCLYAWNQGNHGMGGYLHLYSGEEAIAVGIIGALDIAKGDCFIGHYRDHAYALAAGSPPGQVMAEICGKATGCSKGKGGSMHICDAKLGFYGGYGIVGGNVPIALGLAYAIKYRGGDQIAVCFFGDGSMNQGGFHETLNMCQLLKVPVLFVLENNGYAMGTSVERSHANTNLTERVKSYSMKSATVDGQDVVAVHEKMQEIVAEMRRTSEPFFLECMTTRYHGHGAADEAKQYVVYRSKEEVAKAKERDPIHILEATLIEKGILSDSEHKRIHAEAKEAAQAALKFSDDSPFPAPEDLLQDVYA